MKPLFYYQAINKLKHTSENWDILSVPEEIAADFAHLTINAEPKQRLSDGSYSLAYKLAYSGESINERFRTDLTDEQDLIIEKMVSSNTTKYPLILYRGVCELVYQQMVENAKKVNYTNFTR